MVVQVRPKGEKPPLKNRIDGKAVVIFSGGVDSTTLLYDVISQGYRAYPITFFYGQKHKKEVDFAKETCIRLNLVHKFADIGVLGDLAPSALTDKDIKVPQIEYDEDSMQDTVVPNRNMVFIALATSYTISLNADYIFMGAHGGDHALYPDCSPPFVNAMEKVLWVCDYNLINLKVPYLYWTKADIISRGLQLGVDYSKTWSCYLGEELACGKCGTCQERLNAFKRVGVEDPIQYERR